MSCNCSCIDTPDSIRDDTGEDVFAYAQDFNQKAYDTLWYAYRFREIGLECVDKWVQMLNDRIDILRDKYALIFDTYEANLAKITNFDNNTWEMDTVGDTTQDQHSENENLPNTPTTVKKYLTNRGDVNQNGSSNTKQTYHGSSAMNVESLRKFMNELPSPYQEYAMEFRNFFVGVYTW